MAAWKTCKLGEVADYVVERRSAKTLTVDNYISTENLLPDRGGRVVASALPQSGNVVAWQAEDVLVSNIRPYFKKIWMTREGCGGASNDVLVVRARRVHVLPAFLYYRLASDAFFAYMMAGANGAKMPRGNRAQIMRFVFSLPTLSEQERIAGVLGAYDDLIALNARRMALLEKAAHRLYRECFFANPVIMRTCEAEEVCNITIGKTPSRVVQDYFTDKPPGMTWISIADMEPGMLFLSRSSEYLTADAVRRSHIQVVPTGSVLLSFKLTIGRVAIAGEPLTTNEAIAHFRLPSPIWREYVYFYLRDFNYATLGSTSAIGTAINSQIVKRMPFAVPEELARIETFHHQVAPYFEAVGALARENALLREARDGLLPRLLREEA